MFSTRTHTRGKHHNQGFIYDGGSHGRDGTYTQNIII